MKVGMNLDMLYHRTLYVDSLRTVGTSTVPRPNASTPLPKASNACVRAFVESIEGGVGGKVGYISHTGGIRANMGQVV